ncbi:uncharacterized protein METZ01_LOCUS338059, partial [marine metagenome]
MNPIIKLFNLKNKTVILTGSAGRLGTRFARVLSEAGASVVLVDIDEQKNKKLEKTLIQKYKANTMSSNTDISNQNEVRKLVKDVLKKYGKIDVLINNAHFIPRDHPQRDAPFEKYSLDLWDQTTKINMRGLFLCCQEFGKVMVKQKRG